MKKKTMLRLPRWRLDAALCRRLLPYGVLVLAVGACVAVGVLVLLPAWQSMQERQTAAGQAQQALDDRRTTDDMMRRTLEGELAEVTAANEANAGLLLSRQQVTEVLTRLYAEAEARAVQVLDLRGQPTAQPEGPEEAPYQVRNLRLRASGGLPALLGLVAEVQQVAPGGALLLENLQVVPGQEETAMVVDLVLYGATGEDGASGPPSTATPSEGDTPEGSLETDSAAEEVFFVRPTDWPSEWSWPSAEETAAYPADRVHLVVQGDTLYALATRYGVTVEALRAANGLPDEAIYTGQTLRIP